MRLMTVVLALLVLVVGLSILPVESATAARKHWGVWADDESIIQIFYESPFSGDILTRIPQDTDYLRLESFWIYLTGFGNESTRTVRLEVLLQVEREVITVDPETNKTHKDTIYPWEEVVLDVDINLTRGMNFEANEHYAETLIDSETVLKWGQARTELEKVRITYRNLKFEFFHKTHPGERPVTKKARDWNIERWGWMIIIVAVLAFASVIGYFFLRRVASVPPMPPWWFYLLFGFAALLAFGAAMLLIGSSVEVYSQDLFMLPLPLGIAMAAIWFVFWVATRFRDRQLRRYCFIEYKLPRSPKPIGEWTDQEILDYRRGRKKIDWRQFELLGYRDSKGRRLLISDEDSWVETFWRLLVGGIRLEFEHSSIAVDSGQNDSKTRPGQVVFDEVVFCEKFEYQPFSVSWNRESVWWPILVASLLILAAVVMILMKAAWITTIPLWLMAVGCFFLWMLYSEVRFTRPTYHVVPITDREVLDIIQSDEVLQIYLRELTLVEHQLFTEKANLTKEARSRVLAFAETARDALVPKPIVSEVEKETEKRKSRKERTETEDEPATIEDD